jgi:hypothetical protein
LTNGSLSKELTSFKIKVYDLDMIFTIFSSLSVNSIKANVRDDKGPNFLWKFNLLPKKEYDAP